MFIKGKYYQFTCTNGVRYFGMCVREVEFDEVDGRSKVGFLSHEENKKEKSDLTVSLNFIKNYKEITLDELLASDVVV